MTTGMAHESKRLPIDGEPAPGARYKVSLPWPRSIRARLTLWYATVFALVFALFGLAFFLNIRATLTSSLDTDLHSRTTQIASGITQHDGGITIDDVTGTLPGLAPGPQDIDDPPAGSSGASDDDAASPGSPDQQAASSVDVSVGTLVSILNNRGQPIYVSPAFQRLSVPQQSVSAALKGASWTGDVSSRSGQRVRLYSMPLTGRGDAVFGVIQVGEPLAPLEATLRTVLLEWLLIAPFALILSALGGYYLASRAFRPITHLIGAAQQIEAADLHQRVPVPQTRDEVQQLALTFNEMISRLEDAFARQRRFVADASHELGTPVAAIRSLSEVALTTERDAVSEDYEVALRSISGEAERLGRLVADLLALARADENRILLEREPVRLDTLAADVVAVLEPLASERGVALQLRTSGPVMVIGDEARLIQAVFNLLDNAIAYSDTAKTDEAGETAPHGQDRDDVAENAAAGAVDVCVLVRVETEGDRALLRVTDSGIGIAPEHWPRIFERFYRVDPSRSRASGGSGLGLAIVDWVARAHHGSIAVQSEVGHGSAFTLTFPLAPPDGATVDDADRQAPRKA